MNTLEANIRNTKTKGELNILRSQGNVPGVIYGGEDKNQNISVSKKSLSLKHPLPILQFSHICDTERKS